MKKKNGMKARTLLVLASLMCIYMISLAARPAIVPKMEGTESRSTVPVERSSPTKNRPQKKGTPPSKKKKITMNFDNVDIRQLIKFISDLTGKNFIVDDRVKASVTVVAPSPVTVEEAYAVFESILEVYGFAAVPSGKVIKIVPRVTARQKSVETRAAPQPAAPSEDRLITQLVSLKYADADKVKATLAPLVSSGSMLLSYKDTNLLIITDMASNVRRLMSIIKEIDVPKTEATLKVVKLKYASARETAQQIESLVKAGSTAATATIRGRKVTIAPGTLPPFQVIPDERTNSLIILAGKQMQQKITGLLQKLDIPTPKGRGKVRVYYLKHAVAEDLAKVLNKISTAKPTGKKGTVPGRSPQPLMEGVSITADKATNSLIITALPEDYDQIVKIIEKLDIPRPQVFIEALFLEVSATKKLDLGVEWYTFTNPHYKGKEGAAMVSSSTRQESTIGSTVSQITAGQIPSFPGGFALGILGETIQYGNLVIPSLGALVQALKNETGVNILSNPQILTMDNEQAQIIVSTNVPYTVRTDVDRTNINRTVRTYAYKDVGVTLKVTPQITKDRNIRLKLFQEVSSLVSQTIGTGPTMEIAPTTLKRQAETTVLVKDHHSIVIAGLMGEKINTSDQMAPCLGELPVVGWLFKSLTKNREKTNLVIFLTPHIIDTPEKIEELRKKKEEEIKELKKEMEEKEMLRKKEKNAKEKD